MSSTVVTDGYQVYHTFADEREDLIIAGCWSHARRKRTDCNEWGFLGGIIEIGESAQDAIPMAILYKLYCICLKQI